MNDDVSTTTNFFPPFWLKKEETLHLYSSEPFVEIDRYCIDIAKIFGKEKRKEIKERKVMEHDIYLEY